MSYEYLKDFINKIRVDDRKIKEAVDCFHSKVFKDLKINLEDINYMFININKSDDELISFLNCILPYKVIYSLFIPMDTFTFILKEKKDKDIEKGYLRTSFAVLDPRKVVNISFP